MQNNCVAQQRDKAYVIRGHARGQIGKQAIKSADKCIKNSLRYAKTRGLPRVSTYSNMLHVPT